MSEDTKDKKEQPKAEPKPKVQPSKPETKTIEQWAEDVPFPRVTASMVIAHRWKERWAIGRMITEAEWRKAVNELLSTPIGFKN